MGRKSFSKREHPNQCFGEPPEIYQCNAIRRNGKRCRKWRLRGQRCCQFHGGRRGRTQLKSMPGFYRDVLSKTLDDVIQAAMEQNPSEQVSLLEELALMRLTAREAVALYSAAQASDQKTKDMAAGVMVDALKNVQSIAESAARINAASKEQLSATSLKVVVHQITRIAYEVIGDTQLAEEFERRIRDKVRLPDETKGTLLTPDQDVQEMDDSVPRSS